MSHTETASPKALAAFDDMFDRIRERLRTLGMSLSVWDRGGECVASLDPACEFCRTLCGARACCSKAGLGEAVADVVGEGRAVSRVLPSGCCLLAVPLRKRRRPIGMSVAWGAARNSMWMCAFWLPRISSRKRL